MDFILAPADISAVFDETTIVDDKITSVGTQAMRVSGKLICLYLNLTAVFAQMTTL